MNLSRRSALTLTGAACVCAPAVAQPTNPGLTAPPAAQQADWVAYEARLQSRLTDSGGTVFDEESSRNVLALTNEVRTEHQSPQLFWHAELALAARAHAGDLAKRSYLEHISPEGFDPSHRLWLVGRTTIGSPTENLAFHRAPGVPASAAQMMNVWRTSPRHWQNHLRPDHTHAAFALIRLRDQAWLVGLYANLLATLPEPLPFEPDARQVARALESLPGVLRGRLTSPQGARPDVSEGKARVRQLTAIRRQGVGAYDVIGGPIFLNPS